MVKSGCWPIEKTCHCAVETRSLYRYLTTSLQPIKLAAMNDTKRLPMTRGTLGRRHILKMSAVVGALGAVSPFKCVLAQSVLRRTQDQIMGPFYPVMKTPDRSGDLTRVNGSAGRAKGQVLNVTGRVVNPAGEPVRDARVEIWQANAAGRYAHPDDPNPAPLDPNFEGFGVVTTDAEGRYRFKTIKPAAYPTGPTSMCGRPTFTSRLWGATTSWLRKMYFEGDPYNEKDRYLQSARRPEELIVKLNSATAEFEPDSMTAVFDIVLRG